MLRPCVKLKGGAKIEYNHYGYAYSWRVNYNGVSFSIRNVLKSPAVVAPSHVFVKEVALAVL